ncbi:MAG: ATPase, T2SS/T4P/T4SS family [Gammaproteobacteria bacterium]
MRLTPRGALSSAASVDALREALNTTVLERNLKLIVDFGACPSVDSVCLEVLLDAQDQLVRLGGWLKLANVNPLLLEIFELCDILSHIALTDPPARAEVADTQRGRLGDILIAQGHLTETQAAQAAELQASSGMRIGHIVVEKGWVSESDLLAALGVQLGVPVVSLRAGVFDPAVSALIPRAVAVRLCMFGLFRVRDTLYVATPQPQALPALAEIKERTGLTARPVLARRDDVLRMIEEAEGGQALDTDLIAQVDDDFALVENVAPEDYTTIDEIASASPVINLVNSIIQRSIRDGASDVHIEPAQNRARVRYRIDGVLYQYKTIRMDLHPSLVSRLKVMANLDIAERRLPQDGRIQVSTQGRSVDLRFSSLPGMFGEKVVLRILDKRNAILDIDRLGMADQNLSTFKDLLTRSHGLVLVTGPTGSGKTTSLYAALNHLNSIEKNIVTIEDPVEYQLDIINQNQVRPAVGLGFARILKHVLRQDPDIVMVGEIREHETAQIAVQAALTGHLVLSTLHTNDSIGAVTRMSDMGVEPYLLSSALVGVVAQRLVRGICPSCKATSLAPPSLIERMGWESETPIKLSRGRGCSECYDSGYRGRVGIHEVLATDDSLQELILKNPSRDALARHLDQRGVRRLFDDGMDRVLEQRTTIEEVNRAVSI